MFLVLLIACTRSSTLPWSQPTAWTLGDTGSDTAADTSTGETDRPPDSDTAGETAEETDSGRDSHSGGSGSDDRCRGYGYLGDWPDADADGWSVTCDCDDTDPDVYPGSDAEDIEGDGIDDDCNSYDGETWVGCSPHQVPDIWPTLADALADMNRAPCVGEGTFSLPASPDNDLFWGFSGQGRDLTTVILEDDFTYLGYVSHGTVTGFAYAEGGFGAVDATLSSIELSLHPSDVRLTLDRTTVEDSVIGGGGYEPLSIRIRDSFVRNSQLRFTNYGCWDPERDPTCAGAGDFEIEISNSTFTDVSNALQIRADGVGELWFRNNVFFNLTGAFASWDLGGVDEIVDDANVAWNVPGSDDVDETLIEFTEADPMFEEGTEPPRPGEGSPLIDAAYFGSETDYWGNPRKVPDIGAVER